MEGIEKTKKAALRLLSFRPRSESELRSRLAMKKLPAPAIETVIEDLRREKMLDDGRFAKLYALSRIQSGAFGKDRVKRELARKGLSAGDVTEAMESISDIDEYSTAEKMAKRKLATMKSVPREAKKRRLHGAMLRRGFSVAVIFKVLNGLLEAGDDEGI